MLIKPEFDLDKLNEEYKDRGVLFTSAPDTLYDKSGTMFKGIGIKDHEFWKKHNLDTDGEINIFGLFVENESKILWGWNVDNDVQDYSNLKLVDRFPNFDLSTGISYTDDEYRHILFGKDETLLTKPTPTANLTGSYGVCDNVEQVLEFYKNVINNPNENVILSLSEICKSDQPESGGWRWHKWGQYIGTQNPQNEYLYDEQDIDVVYIFQINTVKLKDQ